jgi:hypothetical protein
MTNTYEQKLAAARERCHKARDEFYPARTERAKLLHDPATNSFRKPKTKQELIVEILWLIAEQEWNESATEFDAIRNNKDRS